MNVRNEFLGGFRVIYLFVLTFLVYASTGHIGVGFIMAILGVFFNVLAEGDVN